MKPILKPKFEMARTQMIEPITEKYLKEKALNAELLEMLYRIREGKSEYIDKAIAKAEGKDLGG